MESGVVMECDVFQLFGDSVIQGQYKLELSFETGYVLSERFPELIDADLSEEDLFYDGWSSYQVSKISPDIVGNTALEGYQCHHPQGNEVFDLPMPALIESEYVDLDHGAYTGIEYLNPRAFYIKCDQNPFCRPAVSGRRLRYQCLLEAPRRVWLSQTVGLHVRTTD